MLPLFKRRHFSSFPQSTKIRVAGTIHPEIRVPFREIQLTPNRRADGRMERNDPVRVYDTSGPWGDPRFVGTIEEGLPPLRRDWILRRGDVVEVEGGRATRSLRARPGGAVTQMQYARQGVITPEMEYVAIRENLGRQGAPGGGRPL